MADADDIRLGVLLDQLQKMRDADPSARVEDLRQEAGPLYDELVELAACVDCMLDTAIPSPAPERRAPAESRRRSWFVVTGAVLLCLGVAGVWATQALRSETPARTATEDEQLAPFFAARDPFATAALKEMAAAHGLRFVPLPATVTTPMGTASSVGRSRSVVDPRAVALERARLPISVQGTAAARFLLATRLVRIGQDAAALELALALVSEYPDRGPPLALALHALAGLGRVGTTEYAALHARYLGSSDASKR